MPAAEASARKRSLSSNATTPAGCSGSVVQSLAMVVTAFLRALHWMSSRPGFTVSNFSGGATRRKCSVAVMRIPASWGQWCADSFAMALRSRQQRISRAT